MNTPLTLIVDDEPDIRELLEITLSRMDIHSISAEDVSSAKAILARHSINLCLTDMKLPDGDGLDLVEHIRQNHPSIPVAVITAHGSVETAIKAMKNGAFDFISKPVDLSSLRRLVNNAIKVTSEEMPERRSRHTLLGDSDVMCTIRGRITKLARSQAPVYISGESGSGKELVARLIHQKSPRHEKPFIAINCGAIPQELMESEFFGHKKGSFTGATSDKEGLFQAAEGGTLFLDEVADLPQPLQVKLLRAIQEKRIRQVGGHQEIPVDIRLLSATHKDLAQMVQNGEFRQDLYYRINVIDLSVPPLRKRIEDIPQLTDHILKRLARNMGFEAPKITPAAMNALKKYFFPGNVRELENILERALALYDGQEIDVDDLDLPVGSESIPEAPEFDPSEIALEEYLEAIERRAISDALEKNRWNKTAAAKSLGLTFRSLRYRLKKLNME